MTKFVYGIAIGVLFCANIARASENPRILEINNFVGQIEVKTAKDAEFSINYEQGNSFKASHKSLNNTLIVGIENFDASKLTCNSGMSGRYYKLGSKKYKPEDFPKIIVTMPSSNGLRIKNAAVEGVIGDVGGAALSLSSCGKVQIGNITHALELVSEGATNVQTGSIGEYARINIEGASSVKTGSINGLADIKIEGVGSLNSQSANGIKLDLEGTGSVKIMGGKGPFDVNLEGTGSLDYDGIAVNPKVRISGIGNVRVREIVGNKDIKLDGVGKFTVK